MGLFSGIGKIVGSVVGGITGGTAQAKAAGKAADLQHQAALAGVDEQRRQFDLSRADQMPWLDVGRQALGEAQTLLGLNGFERQNDAIAELKYSPQFQHIFNTGAEALLQNAAATGGLRGGNLQESLADWGGGVLNTLIQQQLSNFGGLSGTGVGAAQNIGALGANSASNISNLLQQGGAAQAGGILAKGGRDRQAFGDLLNIGSMAVGGGIF